VSFSFEYLSSPLKKDSHPVVQIGDFLVAEQDGCFAHDRLLETQSRAILVGVQGFFYVNGRHSRNDGNIGLANTRTVRRVAGLTGLDYYRNGPRGTRDKHSYQDCEQP